MTPDSLPLNGFDLAALLYFIFAWTSYSLFSERVAVTGRETLSAAMNRHRATWIRTMARRDMRMIDTSIMAGLQNGCAFFASSSLIALGGAFALLGSPDQVAGIVAEISLGSAQDRSLVEVKLIGLIAVLAYSFFKFGWAYRLFNYCSILIGAVPMPSERMEDPSASDTIVEQAVNMNILGGKHFNAGLRGVFFSIAYLGWFAGPAIFVISSTFIAAVLARRQFFSAARRSAIGDFSK